MEMDQPVASGPVTNDVDFQEKVAIAEKALLSSDSEQTFARRARKDVLQLLCRNRCLDDKGEKIKLASRLIDWVGAVSSAISLAMD